MPKYRIIEEYRVEVTHEKAIDIIAKTRRHAQECYYDSGDDAGLVIYDKEISRDGAFDSDIISIEEAIDA